MPRSKASSQPVDRTAETAALSTAQRILDAAEVVFARGGYHGATIRDITDAAGVQLSLARYHFGSKDQLFQQVLERRAEATCSQLEIALTQALADAAPDAKLEAVVDAMVSVAVERLASGDVGWRHYLRLLTHLNQLVDRPELLQPFRDRYSVTLSRYKRALQRALPGTPEATVMWALHFLQILVGHALLDLAVTGLMSGTASQPTDWNELRRQLVTHVVGGMRAQAALGQRRSTSQSARTRSVEM